MRKISLQRQIHGKSDLSMNAKVLGDRLLKVKNSVTLEPKNKKVTHFRKYSMLNPVTICPHS